MKLRDWLWCVFNGYCPKHAVKKYWDGGWAGGSYECAVCEAEDILLAQKCSVNAELHAARIRESL